MILPHRSARFYSRRIIGSLAALSYNGRDIPVTAEDTEEYFHDDLVYFRKNVGDLSLLEGIYRISRHPLGNRSYHPLLLQGGTGDIL